MLANERVTQPRSEAGRMKALCRPRNVTPRRSTSGQTRSSGAVRDISA